MGNAAIFANLPRFDDTPTVHVTLPIGMTEFDDFAAPAPPPVALDVYVEPEPEELPEPELEPAPPPAPVIVAPDLSAVAQAAAALSATIERVEQEAHQQVVAAIQDMASQLFPKLANRFLAGEIGLHLRDLVPVSVGAVEVQAAPDMADALADIVDGLPELSQRCTILPREMEDETKVEVSWKAGGVSFDFAGLLAGCLARMGPKQPGVEG